MLSRTPSHPHLPGLFVQGDKGLDLEEGGIPLAGDVNEFVTLKILIGFLAYMLN